MKDRLPYPPPFQDIATLSMHIGYSEATIEDLLRQGIFPAPLPPIKEGGKRIWEWKAVERWMLGHKNVTSIERGRDIREATRRISQRG